MNNPAALFACSKCFTRHPFEDLSAGQQLCKECRGAFPVVKCTYCRSEFQQSNKTTTSTICTKCEQNVKSYGKPSACEYCNTIAAFIGNKCQRCTNSERKHGPPIMCEQCKQKCAFDRKDEEKKQVDGKLLCWLCTLSFKRALAKTKQTDAEKTAQMKMAAQRSSKNKDGRSRNPNRRVKRVDISKLNHTSENSSSGLGGNDLLSGLPPPAKLQKVANHRSDLDPNSSDHVVAITQLKEQMASLQKQVTQKNLALREKDKMITDLKAKHFTEAAELRNKMQKEATDYDKKIELMSSKIKTLQKEVATLSKNSSKRTSGLLNKSNAGGGGSGSGTDSPSMG